MIDARPYTPEEMEATVAALKIVEERLTAAVKALQAINRLGAGEALNATLGDARTIAQAALRRK